MASRSGPLMTFAKWPLSLIRLLCSRAAQYDNVCMLSRRRFLQTSSLSIVSGTTVRAKKLQTIGVQLYTVRDLLPNKTSETLHALDALGYREAEGNFADLGKIVPLLRGLRLRLISVHI